MMTTTGYDADGDVRYYYDDNGNLVEKESAEEDVLYIYDAENHLIRVETTRLGVAIVVEYAYDAAGNRVKKTIDRLITTTYLVDENRDYAQVLEECDGDGNLIVRYVYGHDLISQTGGGATTYYHYDGLGSTRALTNGSEGITSRILIPEKIPLDKCNNISSSFKSRIRICHVSALVIILTVF